MKRKAKVRRPSRKLLAAVGELVDRIRIRYVLLRDPTQESTELVTLANEVQALLPSRERRRKKGKSR